jgi:Putative prokaryotic signal transducing protein
MRVIASSTNQVRLSFLVALLADAGIETVLLDSNISAVEGGIGVFPRRLAVSPEDERRAVRVLREAGEADM